MTPHPMVELFREAHTVVVAKVKPAPHEDGRIMVPFHF